MIAKQIKGTSFYNCLDYLLGKEGSEIIGGNMEGRSVNDLAKEFKLSQQLNSRVKRYVYHASLSVASDENIGQDKWKAIAADYLEGMNFTDNQYVIVGHSDTKHNHIHIVASRVKMDGKSVHDGWDYVRSEKLVRELEKKYDLEPTIGSKERLQRSPTTGERRLRERTKQASVREILQQTIDDVCTQGDLTMPLFLSELHSLGIETKITTKSNSLGISYKHLGIAFSGTHLGKAYTFPGLQKHRGISYSGIQDDAIISQQQVLKPFYCQESPPINESDLVLLKKIEKLQQLSALIESQKKKQDKEVAAIEH